MKRIPLVRLALDAAEVEATLAAMRPVLEGGRFLLGEETRALEAELAARAGVGHAVSVASGTDAITIALLSLGIGPGDEVIIPAFTAFPTAVAVLRTGADPVLADVCPETPILDLAATHALITPRTRAVVVVHLYGIAADVRSFIDTLSPLGIVVVEDCAQAFGAVVASGEPVGSCGAAGAYSFYPTKNLGAVGDGGALVTDDPGTAAEARAWRSHGERGKRYVHELPAGNSRLDELQAAVLRHRLTTLDSHIGRRQEISRRYGDAFAGVVPYAAHGDGGAPHLAVVRVSDPALFAFELDKHGIDSGRHYPLALVDQPALRGVSTDDATNARQWARTSVSLPLHPHLSDSEVDRVIAAVLASARDESS